MNFGIYQGSKLVLLSNRFFDLGTSLFTPLSIISAVGGITLSISYGIDIKQTDDPFIDLAEKAMHTASQVTIPGALLVDMIPILKYVPEFVPGAGFQKRARIWRKLQEDFRSRPYLASIEAMVFYSLSL